MRIYVGTTYGTYRSNEEWWGWATGDDRHKDWLALVLSAKAMNKPVVVYDDEGSGHGPGGDIVGLERPYSK